MEKNSYPTIKDAIFLCLFLGAIQFGMILIPFILVFLYGVGLESQNYMRGQLFLSILSFAIVIYWGYKKSYKKFDGILKFNGVSLHIWLSIIIFMSGFVLLVQRIDSISSYLIPSLQSMSQELTLYCVNEHLFVSLLLIGIILPFTQEILFRGIILNGFKENYSQKKSIIISAVLFGITTLSFPGFVFGIISAWICLKTKSIIPSIFIDMLYNSASVFMLKFSNMAPVSEFIAAYNEHPFKLSWYDAIGLVLTVAGIFLLLNSIRKHKAISNDSI